MMDELQKIAKLMAVDEIHLFDDQGTIYSGSAPGILAIILIRCADGVF
ncbi:MAG: hypothetical protein ACLUGJ_07745 [Blautia wexlerae]